MILLNETKGFTLIELLLVVVIIGLSLAVIVPRAWRANVDTKYGLVRQNCSELASYGIEWAEGQLLAQNESSPASLKNYLDSLSNNTTGCWIADPGCNWSSAAPVVVQRTPASCEANVRDIVPPEKIPRNPFNGASVFVISNNPGATPIPGAIACCSRPDNTSGTTWYYYAFLFQGTDSSSTSLADAGTFYAGQDATTLPGLRNGIFFARTN